MDDDLLKEILDRINTEEVNPNNFLATLLALDKENHQTVVGMIKRSVQSTLSNLDDQLASKVKQESLFENINLGDSLAPKNSQKVEQNITGQETDESIPQNEQTSETFFDEVENINLGDILAPKNSQKVEQNEQTSETFFDEVENVNIESFSDDAIDQLFDKLNISSLGDMFTDLQKSIDGISINTGDVAMGGGLLGGIVSKLLSGMGVKGAVGASLAAAGPVAATAGGVLWAAIDGIRGFFAADEWGVSKLSGVFGSILGGMDSGVSGAFKNMGKWALIGAGIGSVVPVVGTILGGIIGGVVGAILGFIGGEKIAKGFDFVVKWATDHVMGVFTFLQDSFEKLFGWLFNIGSSLKDWFAKFMDPTVDTIDLIKDTFSGLMNWYGDTVLGFLNWVWDFVGVMFAPIIDIFKGAKKLIIDAFDSSVSFITVTVENIKEKLDTFFGKIGEFVEPVIEKINEVFGFLKDVGGMLFSGVKDVVDPVIENIVNAFTGVFEFGQQAVEAIRERIARIPGIGRLLRTDEEKDELEINKLRERIKKDEEKLEQDRFRNPFTRGRTERQLERSREALRELEANQANDFILQDGKIQKFNENDVLLGSKDGGAFQKGLNEIKEAIEILNQDINNNLSRIIALEEEKEEGSTIINNSTSQSAPPPAPETKPSFRNPSDIINQRGNFWRTQYAS